MENTNAANLTERYCALIVGILFLIIGVAGFIPGLVSLQGTNVPNIPADEIHRAYNLGYGYVFGLFPTNFLHNIVRSAVGLLGIASYSSLSSARAFNRGFAIAYALLAIMGLLPFARTTFGLMPISGNNVWFNALVAIATAYYGIVIPAKVKGTSLREQS
ncbi:DUF4383 domain-containing protein [Gloeocapsa sp. BRSZ]